MKKTILALGISCLISAHAAMADNTILPRANATWDGPVPTFVTPAADNISRYSWDISIETLKKGATCKPGNTVQCYSDHNSMHGIHGSAFNTPFSGLLHSMMQHEDGYFGGLSVLSVTDKQTGNKCDFLAHNNLSLYKNSETVTLNPETCTASI